MKLILRTDGGARGNPGPAGAGVVIENEKGEILFRHGFFLGKATNNQAEYEGMLRAVRQARQMGATELQIFCDSELIVKQVRGEYKVKNPELRLLHGQVTNELEHFAKVKIDHVYREANALADALVNRAIDARKDVDGGAAAAKKPKAPAAKKSQPQAAGLLKSTDLRAQVKFSPQATRELLSREGAVSVEMICLQAGQICRVEPQWAQALLTVIRGAGTIILEAGDELEKQAVRAGILLHLGAAGLDLAADQGDVLVVILTKVAE